ncbi:hypothetical protein [Salinibacter sp.]|uniref:hypothetical protein n=1 Tax=Salinibacter sp. TaxID=2065818 RepID=UPI0021E73677|nr:hypothetical protein [Salinibacter sp.]
MRFRPPERPPFSFWPVAPPGLVGFGSSPAPHGADLRGHTSLPYDGERPRTLEETAHHDGANRYAPSRKIAVVR